MLAALSGCMSTQQMADPSAGHFGRTGSAREVPGVVGPWGAPVAMTARNTAAPVSGGEIIQVSGFDSGRMLNGGTVPPPPYAGPQGAVAAVGALPPGAPVAMGNARSSVRFAGPQGMKIAWYAPTLDGRAAFRNQLEAPGRYNFVQGAIYRLKLSEIANKPGLELYPTIEVVPQNPKTLTFLAHSAIPVNFTDDDFEQVLAGNFVVKVVYLPDPQFQDLALAGVDEVVSTKLEPGVDPIHEAQRRGSVLLIVRMGNIDLEAPNTPGMDAPNPYLGRPALPEGTPAKPPVGAPKVTGLLTNLPKR